MNRKKLWKTLRNLAVFPGVPLACLLMLVIGKSLYRIHEGIHEAWTHSFLTPTSLLDNLGSGGTFALVISATIAGALQSGSWIRRIHAQAKAQARMGWTKKTVLITAGAAASPVLTFALISGGEWTYVFSKTVLETVTYGETASNLALMTTGVAFICALFLGAMHLPLPRETQNQADQEAPNEDPQVQTSQT